VIDERSKRNGYRRYDRCNASTVFPIIHEVKTARQGRHHDSECEDLTEYRDSAESTIVSSAIVAILLCHSNDSLSETRKNLIEMGQLVRCGERGYPKLLALSDDRRVALNCAGWLDLLVPITLRQVLRNRPMPVRRSLASQTLSHRADRRQRGPNRSLLGVQRVRLGRHRPTWQDHHG